MGRIVVVYWVDYEFGLSSYNGDINMEVFKEGKWER
jgi:hypothetical protein